jgi:hypothetical protein
MGPQITTVSGSDGLLPFGHSIPNGISSSCVAPPLGEHATPMADLVADQVRPSIFRMTAPRR